MTLTIHTLTADDHAAVEALYTLSVKANPDGFIQDLSFHGSIVEMATAFIQNGGDMRVAKAADGTLVGMGALRPIDTTRTELCKLHVHPRFQGFGYGKKLSHDLLEQAQKKSFKVVELHVTETQKAAIGLYKKLGFQTVKTDTYQTEVHGQMTTFPTVYMEKPL